MEQLERSALLVGNVNKWLQRYGWWLGAIAVFVLIRVFFVWKITPQSLNPDEAALLLNARFIVERGVDEWGKQWPFIFDSFGDAKLPGYVYLLALTGWIGNYVWWTARVPSFVAGLFLPFLVARFAWQLVEKRWAVWATFLAVILSPWSWHYGTTGFEANVGLTLFVAALIAWFRTPAQVQKETPQQQFGWDLLGMVFYICSVVTYNSPLLLFPVLFTAGLLWRWKNYAAMLRFAGATTIVFATTLFITLPITLQKSSITLWSDGTVLSLYPAYREQFSGMWQTILGNQYVYFGQLILQNWVNGWSWDFLVNKGGNNPWHGIPLIGHMHMFMPVLAIWTAPIVFARWWKKQQWRRAASVAILLLGATLPAIVTVDAPHATRSLFFFVMMSLLAGIGLGWFMHWLRYRTHWALRLMAVSSLLFVLLAGWLWWFTPAYPRWQKNVNPKWQMNLRQTLQDERVQSAPQVVISDLEGVFYTYIVIEEDLSAEEFLSTVERSEPSTVNLYRVTQAGRYQFAHPMEFEQLQIDAPPGSVGIKQQSNTTWDIIEL